MSFLEYASAAEEQFDFCLWPYRPLRPVEGKLRSISLLANSLESAGVGSRGMDMVRAIREDIGVAKTVWGIKQAGSEVGWELYFYDYDRVGRTRSIPRLLQTLRPWVACDVEVSEGVPYFMFSLEFSRELLGGVGALDAVQMYLGNVGSLVSSGICYEVTRRATRLKNFYFFFDAKREMAEIEGKVQTSAYLDPEGFRLDDVLLPELRGCEIVVVANKPDRDGIYFSRIDVTQLLWFLKRMAYPEAQIRFLEDHLGFFDHMFFDVGFDYRVEDGRLKILKSAYYGVF